MSHVFKLVFRFDFDLCPGLMDQPGEALQILSPPGDKFWAGISESPGKHLFSFRHDEKGHVHRSLSFEPKALFGVMEFGRGVHIAEIEHHDDFVEVSDRCKSLMTHFEITNVVRGGVRAHIGARSGIERPQIAQKFMEVVRSPIEEITAEALGNARDIMISYDGTDRDEILYHFHCGPLTKDNITGQILNDISELNADQILEDGFDMLFDIDLYEQSFDFTGQSLSSWSKTKFPKMKDLCNNLSREIRGEPG